MKVRNFPKNQKSYRISFRASNFANAVRSSTVVIFNSIYFYRIFTEYFQQFMFPIKFFSLFAMKKSRENESEADLVSGEGSRLVVWCSQWKAKKNGSKPILKTLINSMKTLTNILQYLITIFLNLFISEWKLKIFFIITIVFVVFL